MKIMSLAKESIAKAVTEGEVTACVIGLGRIGLPTAAVFCRAGARVIGVGQCFE